jgi:hypothetical protein
LSRGPEADISAKSIGSYDRNSVSLAKAAPCVRDFSFAQAICGCERPPKPQSDPDRLLRMGIGQGNEGCGEQGDALH